MEAQTFGIFARVLGPHQGVGIGIEPVIEPRQKKAQRRAAHQERQGALFLGGEGAPRLIRRDQCLAFGDVVGAVGFEAPAVQGHRQVIGVHVVAGEIEIDQAGDTSPA